MTKIKFLGVDGKRAYHGMDPETNTFIHISKGEVIDVSDKKKKQLFKDFPEEWETVKEKSKEPEPEKLSRDELKKTLDNLGIDYAKNASTKKLEELVSESHKEKTDE
jgi:hypothetical protein